MGDPDWVVRREAVITLGEMGDERCVEPLARALRDGDWQVREVAIEGLGQVGSPAVDTLLKLLRDWEVRKYAIAALGKIRDERVLDPLILQLRNDEFKDDAIDALVALGEPSIEKLIGTLRDKDENVRKRAVLALGKSKAAGPLIRSLRWSVIRTGKRGYGRRSVGIDRRRTWSRCDQAVAQRPRYGREDAGGANSSEVEEATDLSTGQRLSYLFSS